MTTSDAGLRLALAAAAAALPATGLTACSPDHPAAAVPRPAGAPATFTSLGYTYGYSRTATGMGRASVTLPDSTAPYLLSWGATAGHGVRLDLGSYDLDLDRQTANVVDEPSRDYSDYHLVMPDTGDHTITATGRGKVSLVVYTLKKRAPGQTVDGITFRDRLPGGWVRVRSAITRPGQVSLRVAATAAPHTDYRIEELVSGVPKGGGAADAYDRYGGNTSGLSWSSQPPFDPDLGPGAAAVKVSARGPYPVAKPMATRLWVTSGPVSPADTAAPSPTPGTPAAGVRLGIAYYKRQRLAPDEIDYDGHLWRAVARVPVHGQSVTVHVDARRTPYLVQMVKVPYDPTVVTSDGRVIEHWVRSSRSAGSRFWLFPVWSGRHVLTQRFDSPAYASVNDPGAAAVVYRRVG